MDIDRVEGNFSHLRHGHAHHAGHPEENDVVARHQHVGGVKIIQLGGFLRPAHGGEGPQARAEPGVQHVFFLADMLAAAGFALLDVVSADGDMAAVVAVPSGNLMAPPQLPGDAPIVNVFHPVQINFREALGHKLHPALLQHSDGLFSQRLHFNEPLRGCDRLHCGAATVALAHIVVIILGFHQGPGGVQVCQNGLPGFITVHPLVFAAVFVDFSVVVQNQNLLQAVPLAHFKVVGVVARGYFDAARAKILFHIFIRENGQLPAEQRQKSVFAVKMEIPLVLWVDGDAGIAQNGFGPGGGDNHILPGLLHLVFDVPQMALLLGVFHLGIRKGGGAMGAPVDNPMAPVDQALLIQVFKRLTHRLRAAFVHGEAAAPPVWRGAQLFLLVQNPAAVLLLPLPHSVKKFLPPQIIASFLLVFPQILLHFDLGGDAGMVHPRRPQGGIPLHPLLANQRILQSHVKSVAHMQLSGDVGRRHYNGIGLFLRVYLRLKTAVFLPEMVNLLFCRFGVIDLFQFFRHAVHSLSSSKMLKRAWRPSRLLRRRGLRTKKPPPRKRLRDGGDYSLPRYHPYSRPRARAQSAKQRFALNAGQTAGPTANVQPAAQGPPSRRALRTLAPPAPSLRCNTPVLQPFTAFIPLYSISASGKCQRSNFVWRRIGLPLAVLVWRILLVRLVLLSLALSGGRRGQPSPDLPAPISSEKDDNPRRQHSRRKGSPSQPQRRIRHADARFLVFSLQPFHLWGVKAGFQRDERQPFRQ